MHKRFLFLFVLAAGALFLLAGCACAASEVVADEAPASSSSAKVVDKPAPASSSSASSSKPKPEPEPEPEPAPEPFYVLISGNDTREGTPVTTGHGADDGSRSDTMMIARVDPATYLITLVTIPRDTRTVMDEGDTCKINEAYNRGGMPLEIKQVEKLTGVPMKYYFNMTFVQFAQFVDSLGGISVHIPLYVELKNVLTDSETISFAPGDYHLNGAEALVFARNRKTYSGESQDATRQIQDRYLVQRFIEFTASQSDEAIDTYVKSLIENTDTNFTEEELGELVKDFAHHKDQIHFLSGTGPWQGALDESVGLWLTYGDDESWHELMRVVGEGGDPTTVVPLP